MTKIINDKWLTIPMSAQNRYMARRAEAKKCAWCGCSEQRPEQGAYCPKHREANSVKSANFYATHKKIKGVNNAQA